jgi:hypothetical protein
MTPRHRFTLGLLRFTPALLSITEHYLSICLVGAKRSTNVLFDHATIFLNLSSRSGLLSALHEQHHTLKHLSTHRVMPDTASDCSDSEERRHYNRRSSERNEIFNAVSQKYVSREKPNVH